MNMYLFRVLGGDGFQVDEDIKDAWEEINHLDQEATEEWHPLFDPRQSDIPDDLDDVE